MALTESSDHNGADACRLLALTGLRMGEVISLRWDQVDLKRGLVAFDARQMKSNRKFTKNVCRDAVEIIARQPRTGLYIFPPPPAQKGAVRRDLDYVSRNAMKQAGIEGASPCHVFRHVFKTYGLKVLRIHPVYLDAMQDHEGHGMTGTYGHLDAESVRSDEEKLQSYLADTLYGRDRKNVVAIGAA